MNNSFSARYKLGLKILERGLALIVAIGIFVFVYQSIWLLLGLDWSSSETFYEFIYRVLLLVIGIELIRMLVAHSIYAILELLAFVIARKMLNPDLTSTDLILSVIAFAVLIATRFYFMREEKLEGNQTAKRA